MAGQEIEGRGGYSKTGGQYSMHPGPGPNRHT